MGHYIAMVDWREKFTRSKGRPGPRYDDDDADFDYAESPVPVLRWSVFCKDSPPYIFTGMQRNHQDRKVVTMMIVMHKNWSWKQHKFTFTLCKFLNVLFPRGANHYPPPAPIPMLMLARCGNETENKQYRRCSSPRWWYWTGLERGKRL